MSAEDIINTLNKYIETLRETNYKDKDIKGHIVLHTQIVPHNVIKLYSIYKQTLWYVSNDNKYIIQGVTSTHRNDKVPAHWAKRHLLDMIYGVINSPKFKNIVEGTYKGEGE